MEYLPGPMSYPRRGFKLNETKTRALFDGAARARKT